MVLKRILMTALGALGMGALAAGSAFAQETPGMGNIPAPDIFDDQITCSMNVPSMSPTPTVIPMGGMTSPLDDAIKTLIDAEDPMATPLVDIEALGLGYVIPPGGNNCGGAVLMEEFNAVAVKDPQGMVTNPAEGDIATDVAHGYTDLLNKFKTVYGDPGMTTGGTARALTAAQKALGDAIEAGRTGASLTPLETAVTRAQDAHDKARAAFTDASAGPIYQAGVAEWMAKAVVTKSLADFNAAAVKADTAKDTLDELNYADYVPLGQDELIDTVFTFDNDGMISAPVLTELTGYANADLDEPQAGTVDPMTGVTMVTASGPTASNFDAAGRLIVPMSLQDTDMDVDTDPVLAPIKADGESGRPAIQMVSDIRQVRTRTRAAADALTKLRDDNLNPALQTIYDEAARRAQAEAEYYDGVYEGMLGDNTNLNPMLVDSTPDNDINEAAPYSIASRNAAYQTEANDRFTAEQTLRAAVADREAATAGVRGAFNTPQSFYEQLVARRQALKVTADRALAKASEDGATPSKTVTDNAAAAAMALADAEEAQATVAAAYGDEDSPTAALVAELLKTGGDDGQALVDAIAAVYNTATSAVSDAEGVIDELRAPVAENSAAIAGHETRITANEADIVALDGRVTTNEADIEALDGRVTVNEGAIAQNADDIMMNAGHIMENRGMIETNATGIMMNAGMIAEMGGAISSNTAGIATNAASITTNSNGIRTLRSGVAAAMAMAGMPEIGDRGVSVGAASYDGESAFAVGVHFSGENSRFKAGITSSGGETGISVGAGWGF
ncbi:YadA C-terminal domain-containing protein [Candidatus Rariloculus sp.]|uniref:YadA C-terminal domain-containing protein n=1 Tax=Candidatus Rariloculus sp. TaxID=3101265 RepID=UPI003D0B6893